MRNLVLICFDQHIFKYNIVHGVFIHSWMIFDMRIYDKSGKLSIFTVLDFIFQDTKDIETRKNGISEINIIHEGLLTVITTFDRIGSSNNCTTSLKSSNNTSLWDRNTLLFHSLMNRGSVLLVHFIKLIDQTDSFISKNHSSTF